MRNLVNGSDYHLRAMQHKTSVISELRDDPDLAIEYLKAALEEDEPGVLWVALRHVAEAQGV
jgi:DNA-binding phage protein